MRPLCCDQQETLTQGYYPRVDLPVINAAPRRWRVTAYDTNITNQKPETEL